MSVPAQDYLKPRRISYPEDEARLPWLKILLDAYFVIDNGVAEGIRREQKQGRQLACAKGCYSCCVTHSDIPVYPLELMGMTWYCVEKLQSPLREQIREQLKNFLNHNGCPFLYEGACSIHSARPIACRQFNVLDKACAEGEDAFHTRRKDVMTPIVKFRDEAFNVMLPFYGITNKAEKRKAIKQGSMHGVARAMRDCNWETTPKRMDDYDANHQ